MILVGRNMSPFVRRVAASLNLLGLPFEQRILSTVDNAAEIQAVNPLGRVPALILDDGEVVVDSNAILDAIDDMVGPDRALVPATGADRRRVMRPLAIAVGATEKTVATYYELRRRPPELTWDSHGQKLWAQAAAGFAALDAMAEKSPWLAGEALSQADITVTTGLDFCQAMLPHLAAGQFPALAALRDRANAIPAIGNTRWKA
jgi:glutathione S-transferase